MRPDEARAVRAAGLSLAAYTVNDPRRAVDLFAWGIDSVITDLPDVLLAP
ncbi:MAG: glycerophosphodiester phosphodiesterase family protein [Gemmataceae bacterium]